MRRAIRPLIRVGFAVHAGAELLVARELFRPVGQMQGYPVRGAGLLHRLGALFARFLVRLECARDVGAGRDGREEDAEGGGVFDGLGGALGDVRAGGWLVGVIGVVL